MTSCGVYHRRTHSPVFAGSSGSLANESLKPKSARTIRTVDSSGPENASHGRFTTQPLSSRRKHWGKHWGKICCSRKQDQPRNTRNTRKNRGETDGNDRVLAEILERVMGQLDYFRTTNDQALCFRGRLLFKFHSSRPLSGVGGFAGVTRLTKFPHQPHGPVVPHCETGVSLRRNRGSA